MLMSQLLVMANVFAEIEKPLNAVEHQLGPGLDLEFETEPQTSAPEPAMYETAYVTSHKVGTLALCHLIIISSKFSFEKTSF